MIPLHYMRSGTDSVTGAMLVTPGSGWLGVTCRNEPGPGRGKMRVPVCSRVMQARSKHSQKGCPLIPHFDCPRCRNCEQNISAHHGDFPFFFQKLHICITRVHAPLYQNICIKNSTLVLKGYTLSIKRIHPCIGCADERETGAGEVHGVCQWVGELDCTCQRAMQHAHAHAPTESTTRNYCPGSHQAVANSIFQNSPLFGETFENTLVYHCVSHLALVARSHASGRMTIGGVCEIDRMLANYGMAKGNIFSLPHGCMPHLKVSSRLYATPQSVLTRSRTWVVAATTRRPNH